MADLNFVRYLNKKYSKESKLSALFSLKELTQIFQDNISELEKKGFDEIALSGLGENFVTYFEKGAAASVCLLFVDVCSFSTRFANYTGEEISSYFDTYYQKVVPIIYKHGGEIDKIIGDGLIVVFGQPFLDKRPVELLKCADACAKDIIKATAGGDFSSKVAFHFGRVNYFKNKSGFYNEYTMIGKPLTELFRLESITPNESISFLENSAVSSHIDRTHLGYTSYGTALRGYYTGDDGQRWYLQSQPLTDLKGVSEYTCLGTIRMRS
ncbi:adenylate/guanylate cyclase domain-containing protein [Chitinophaga sp. CF418]|uniref:adenylate/guanylate cyclase domain-containing protein n=1 Tax=Chitinophaga sp. CF418 TaxID=1855287 RepID=UPI0009119665|nr:adenylate/guanylate cyclase domain-containing protein [Chitinophaga sp. CF418]SHN22258.1 Adenylate and Guanylate cyclase catalytic domain-containing protein [Chitinophaga sp. CF418]